MALEDSEVREYGHGMLSNLAQELGPAFAPYLPAAVQAALASCSQARLSWQPPRPCFSGIAAC